MLLLSPSFSTWMVIAPSSAPDDGWGFLSVPLSFSLSSLYFTPFSSSQSSPSLATVIIIIIIITSCLFTKRCRKACYLPEEMGEESYGTCNAEIFLAKVLFKKTPSVMVVFCCSKGRTRKEEEEGKRGGGGKCLGRNGGFRMFVSILKEMAVSVRSFSLFCSPWKCRLRTPLSIIIITGRVLARLFFCIKCVVGNHTETVGYLYSLNFYFPRSLLLSSPSSSRCCRLFLTRSSQWLNPRPSLIGCLSSQNALRKFPVFFPSSSPGVATCVQTSLQ